MEEKLLTMRNISMTFPGVKALQNVDFTLRKGEIHALMGENGAGTLIHIKSSLHPLLLLVFALSPIIMAMGAFSTEGIRAIPLVIPIFAIFYFVVTISFSIEEKRAEQKLQELLYAAILN